MARKWKVLGATIIAATLVSFVFISNYLAPLVARRNNLNPYYLLSWGAPAVFHEDVDDVGASFKLEPWRFLGLQLPAFAGINPEEWENPTGSPEFQHPVATIPREGQVVIYHSHTTEAFVPSCGKTGSEDLAQTVVKLGQVIAEELTDKNFPVLHVQKRHDKAHNKSYGESRKTATEVLAQIPDCLLLLDIHRDGFGDTAETGRKVTTATIAGQEAGKILLVLSSAHENWEKNNRVANDLNNIMEDKYPGLSRGILIKLNSTYNQDLHPGAILVEVGGHWNTLAEAIYGAELFAQVLIDYLGGGQ